MPAHRELFEEHLTTTLIETGSYQGKGIECALNAGFKRVSSIDLSRHYYNFCCQKFRDNKQVKLWHGDSGDALGVMIDEATKPITFWLDGHYSGGNTAGKNQMTPIINELEQIKKKNIPESIILIDDIGFVIEHAISLEDLTEKLMSINPNYEIVQTEDILIAKPRKQQ
jgi:hypothetical protein